ncbi:two-component system sensor histidine kinase CreC [Psychrobacter ciconiae]|uniref:two-component system sensor histidine kinase CreC n=1 Tax=Psychrobacter ciconiae TaxID=1553449 RepID=UPI00191A141F|nr:two-component system sensor histidine kinase CreC [Psychrobacter ciconiae]
MSKSNAPQTELSQKANPAHWYAKLHAVGSPKTEAKSQRKWLNLSIFFRIWLALALVLLMAATAILTQMFGYIRPTAHQVIEDTLLDTSRLLAVNLQDPLVSGQLYNEDYQAKLDAMFANSERADEKNSKHYLSTHFLRSRIYVTDTKGVVIYDSLAAPFNAEGQDYSRWNDVYLTLKGQFGTRSTSNLQTRNKTAVYVAQPIVDDAGKLIGVVSVGKSVASILPYLTETRHRMLMSALVMSLIALLLAGLVAWWLKQSITLVTQYAKSLAEDTQKPHFYLGNELNSLTDTIETMKHRLENKSYVTDYVHTLTHELKSPLTAIRASNELLEDGSLDDEDRLMLSQTINEQSIKMQQLIDRLLLLSQVEQPSFKLNQQPTDLLALMNSLIKDNSVKLQQQHLAPIELHMDGKSFLNHINLNYAKTNLPQLLVLADTFWLTQALQNIMDNAIYFAKSKVIIAIDSKGVNHQNKPLVSICIFNDGKALPDFALEKAFERYFSLSHQSGSSSAPKKGTGLGLTLVKQVITHHGGTVAIDNANYQNQDGVMVTLTLPLMKSAPKPN